MDVPRPSGPAAARPIPSTFPFSRSRTYECSRGNGVRAHHMESMGDHAAGGAAPIAVPVPSRGKVQVDREMAILRASRTRDG